MKDWERAEEIVSSLIKGKITPGSGNGRIKGDVHNKQIVVEVKQSEGPDFTIKREWLEKLTKQAPRDKEFAIAFFIGLRGTVYFPHNAFHYEEPTWATLTVKDEDFPSTLTSSTHIWKKEDLSTLREFS